MIFIDNTFLAGDTTHYRRFSFVCRRWMVWQFLSCHCRGFAASLWENIYNFQYQMVFFGSIGYIRTRKSNMRRCTQFNGLHHWQSCCRLGQCRHLDRLFCGRGTRRTSTTETCIHSVRGCHVWLRGYCWSSAWRGIYTIGYMAMVVSSWEQVLLSVNADRAQLLFQSPRRWCYCCSHGLLLQAT